MSVAAAIGPEQSKKSQTEEPQHNSNRDTHSTRSILLFLLQIQRWLICGVIISPHHPPFCKFKPIFNSGFQLPTRWEPLVAAIMLCRPDSTKKRVEPTILNKIAIKIRHSTTAGSLFYFCYEFNVTCAVITSSHGLMLMTATGIWI